MAVDDSGLIGALASTPQLDKRRLEVGPLCEMPTGEVHFTHTRRGFSSESGWVYSPNHIPVGRDGDLGVENLGGPW